MPTLAEVRAQLTGPGGAFEVVTEAVDGVEMRVYKDRLPNLRSVAEIAADAGRRRSRSSSTATAASASPSSSRLANSVSAALRDSFGIGHGDRVAVLSANNPEWCLSFWATVNLGAILVGLNGWWKTDEILYGLQDSGRQGARGRPRPVRAHRRRSSTSCPTSRPCS